MSRVLAGITYSDDKMLQSRLHSYQDTQRYRIGAKCPPPPFPPAGAQSAMSTASVLQKVLLGKMSAQNCPPTGGLNVRDAIGRNRHAEAVMLWCEHTCVILECLEMPPFRDCSGADPMVLTCSYEQLPINQPKCPFHLNAEAGAMNFSHDNGEVVPHHLLPGPLGSLTCCFPGSVAVTHGSWCLRADGRATNEKCMQPAVQASTRKPIAKHVCLVLFTASMSGRSIPSTAGR